VCSSDLKLKKMNENNPIMLVMHTNEKVVVVLSVTTDYSTSLQL
jgi:hypothetical protein